MYVCMYLCITIIRSVQGYIPLHQFFCFPVFVLFFLFFVLFYLHNVIIKLFLSIQWLPIADSTKTKNCGIVQLYQHPSPTIPPSLYTPPCTQQIQQSTASHMIKIFITRPLCHPLPCLECLSQTLCSKHIFHFLSRLAASS